MNQNYTTTSELPASPFPSGPSVTVPAGETLIHVMRGDLVNGDFQQNDAAGIFVFFKWKQAYYQSLFAEFSANTK